MKFKKIVLITKAKTKVPITIQGKTMLLEGEIEFPFNVIFTDGNKCIGVTTTEELKKYEDERGEIEELKTELKKERKKNSQLLQDVKKTITKEISKEEGETTK